MILNAHKCPYGICEQRRPRSACASAQTDQSLTFSLIYATVSNDSGTESPDQTAHAQADLGFHIYMCVCVCAVP